jgi:hypothetical protein
MALTRNNSISTREWEVVHGAMAWGGILDREDIRADPKSSLARPDSCSMTQTNRITTPYIRTARSNVQCT